MSSQTQTKTRAENNSGKSTQPLPPTNDARRFDPKLLSIKNLVDKGEYGLALDALSKNSTDPEVLNCRGVCLMRMQEFTKAISTLRVAALNPSTFHAKENVPAHIKINLAIALFFGGEPAGGLEVLAEVKNSDHHPSVQMIRRQTKLWVKEMNLFRRLDWFMNRIAPKTGPVPPSEPIGSFAWDKDNVD